MKISVKWLKEKSACAEGIEWFKNQKERDGVKVVKKLIKENQLSWANWLIVRIMGYTQYASYAVFAAEQVIDIFEKKYPDDKRPRNAIKAAKKCIAEPTKENKKAAANAAYAAADAKAATVNVAYAATDAAANTAVNAAFAAAYDHDAASAAYAYAAAEAAAYAATYTAANTAAMRRKILEYGLKLLEDTKDG